MKYLVIFFVLGFLSGFGKGGSTISVNYKPLNDNNRDLAQVEEIFLKYKVDDAYELYKQTYKSLDNPILTHNLSHYVGEYLYKQLGMDGLMICDEIFNYGCYHGFYGRAFSSEGIEIALEAQSACKKITLPSGYGACIHGIGHGLVAYIGYEIDDLNRALITCDKLEGEIGKKGCYNGAFMEYNTRIMQGGTEEIRELVNENYFDPCILLSDKNYRMACFLEIPSWWASNSLPLSEYRNICHKVENIEERDACLEGVGRMSAVLNNFDATLTLEFCKTFDLSERYVCAINAGQVLVANNSLYAESICDIMIPEEADQCKKYLYNYKCGGLGICQQ